jgi:hypothetical protein
MDNVMPISEPDAEITVFCDAPSHEGRRFKWVYARLNDPSAGRVWVDRTHVPKASLANQRPSFVVLQGNQPLSDDKALALTGGEESRHRYQFKCKWCDMSRAWRGENVDPIFDRLADAGVSEISLTRLAAIVGG